MKYSPANPTTEVKDVPEAKETVLAVVPDNAPERPLSLGAFAEPENVPDDSLSSLNSLIDAGMATAANSIAPSTKLQVYINDVIITGIFINVNYEFQYDRCWAEWNRFCTWHTVIPLGASPQEVLGYLNYISRCRSSSIATAQTHVAALAYHYRVRGLASVTDHSLIRMYLKGIKRAQAGAPVKRYVSRLVM